MKEMKKWDHKKKIVYAGAKEGGLGGVGFT